MTHCIAPWSTQTQDASLSPPPTISRLGHWDSHLTPPKSGSANIADPLSRSPWALTQKGCIASPYTSSRISHQFHVNVSLAGTMTSGLLHPWVRPGHSSVHTIQIDAVTSLTVHTSQEAKCNMPGKQPVTATHTQSQLPKHCPFENK